MYARIQTTDQMPDLPDGEGGLKRLVDTIAGHPGFAGLCALRPQDSSGATLITLWHTEDDARQASDRTRAELGPARRSRPPTSSTRCATTSPGWHPTPRRPLPA